MKKRVFVACFAIAALYPSAQAWAQFTDARTYDNTPTGINQVEVGYEHVSADASIDAALIIEGARLHLNQGAITYTDYFGLLHRLAWIEAGIPGAVLGGSISGTGIQSSRSGAGDSSYQVAMLVKGGPGAQLRTV